MKYFNRLHRCLARALALALLASLSPASLGAVVAWPQLGGGAAGIGVAPMKHADVRLDGTTLIVHVDENVDTPQLRELPAGDQFNPADPWGVLQGTAHNFQYGWNSSQYWQKPAGTEVWVEQLAASPGLMTYEARFPGGTYEPIFGTEGSSPRWLWNGSMMHNAYAVLQPSQPQYEASYRVYLGDAAGVENPAYTAAEVTFTWFADVPSADYDGSGVVDGGDLLLWQREFGAGAGSPADGNGDASVDGADLALWQAAFPSGTSAPAAAAVPEPTAAGLAAAALVTAWALRRRSPLRTSGTM